MYTQFWARLRSIIPNVGTKAAIRALLITLIGFFLAFQCSKHRLWRDPHSGFFNSDHVYDFHYSKYRTGEAERFIQAANSTNQPQTSLAGDDPIFCAAFVTVKRPEQQYLTGSIGSMLEGLEQEERNATRLHLLFADTQPTKHPEWNAPWLSRAVDQYGTYNISEEDFHHMQEMEKERNFYVKGMFDYIYVLEDCMNTTAKYIAIFEDDIIFAVGWMARLINALAQLQDTTRSRSVGSWLYLRLFHTETSLMWERDDLLYAYMPAVFALAMMLTYIATYGLRSRFGKLRPHLDTGTIVVLCWVTAPLLLLLVYLQGKWALVHPHGVTKLNQHGCCSQALVFPRHQIPSMIEWLRWKHGQTDTLIEKYADLHGLDRYALFPQAVQHVGRQSSRDNTPGNSQSTWAFYFEQNEPENLAQQHEKSIKQGLPWATL